MNSRRSAVGAWRLRCCCCFLFLIVVSLADGYNLNAPLMTPRAGARRSFVVLSSSSSSSSSHDEPRIRKREIMRKCISSASLSAKRKVGRSGVKLGMNSDNNDNNDNNESYNNKEGGDDKNKVEVIKAFIVEKFPPKALTLIEEAWKSLLNARMAIISFVAGIVLCGAAIFVPVYHQVENLSEPVTLFETILSDIDRGYVDEVDTNKLFETGVSAMLRSLDPYTEFEGKSEAEALNESIDGKYGGVGLVISGATPRDLAKIKKEVSPATTTVAPPTGSKLLPQDAVQDNINMEIKDGDNVSRNQADDEDRDDDDDEDEDTLEDRLLEKKMMAKVQNQGIRVVSAFEGYSFDYGMRVGDKLVAIDGKPVTPQTSVEDVRSLLRGTPGTDVDVSFEREGVEGVQTVSIRRTVVKIRDVKLASLIGNPADGIGYIQLTGFASDAGRETRNAILALQRQVEDATDGERSLQGLILDMRGNPGGLLTSAVDVASLLVPKNSDIVSARGRGFPGVLYRSRVDPILDESTKLAVLVNGGTASAAEIVTGAIQDLDVGIVVGSDRTFGKGLVQNVEELPFNTALKFTVAKYYTPSGRCIQGINYSEGGGNNADDGGKYIASKVASRDRAVFYTKAGREIKDGGGVEVDYKVSAPKASALEVTLLRSGVISDFAAQWSRKNELTNNFEVDESTYKDFQNFVAQKQKDGDIKLEGLYSGALGDLRRILKQSDYKGASKELENLQATIVREVQRDFERYKDDIKEDVAQGILARYLPESMLIERSIKTDKQVLAAVKLVRNERQFDTLLARGSNREQDVQSSSLTATANKPDEQGARLRVKW